MYTYNVKQNGRKVYSYKHTYNVKKNGPKSVHIQCRKKMDLQLYTYKHSYNVKKMDRKVYTYNFLKIDRKVYSTYKHTYNVKKKLTYVSGVQWFWFLGTGSFEKFSGSGSGS